MKEYRLLMVDSDADYVHRMTEYLTETPGLRVVGIAGDGSNALRLLETTKPDVVLMDPLLPELDGIALLKSMNTMKHRPVVICAAQFYTKLSIELARRNGANYYVYKPIEPKALASIICECVQMASEMQKTELANHDSSADNDRLRAIIGIMRELGFSTKLQGSEYIAHAVHMAVKGPTLVHNLSSGLYKNLAEKMHTSVSCIERSMRTAIAAANTDGRLQSVIGAVPTNKTCIRYILGLLKLQ